jgi:hypothetical protein
MKCGESNKPKNYEFLKGQDTETNKHSANRTYLSFSE